MVIVSPLLCRLFSIVVPVAGITLWPFILLAEPPDPVTENHERIHLRQQVELLIVAFYVVYVAEWLWHLAHGKNGEKAYDALRFEREAYLGETDPGYLAGRPFLAWRKLPLNPPEPA